jgi:hypothetical protein
MVTDEDFYREGIPGLVRRAAGRDPKLQEEFAAPHVAVYRCIAINNLRSLTVAARPQSE